MIMKTLLQIRAELEADPANAALTKMVNNDSRACTAAERAAILDERASALATPSVKTWPSKAEFWAEFTTAEKLAILDSTIPGIRLLDKELTMWSGQVMSDDGRIEEGLSALVAVGILTAARKTEILA